MIKCLTVAKDKNGSTPQQTAQGDCLGRELDHDETPYGKRESKPDGDCVDHDTEVGVE